MRRQCLSAMNIVPTRLCTLPKLLVLQCPCAAKGNTEKKNIRKDCEEVSETAHTSSGAPATSAARLLTKPLLEALRALSSLARLPLLPFSLSGSSSLSAHPAPTNLLSAAWSAGECYHVLLTVSLSVQMVLRPLPEAAVPIVVRR